MAVTEVLHSLGSFELKLNSDVPREVLDAIDYFGHVAILPGRVDTVQAGNNSLTAARYVGVIRKKKIGDDGRTREVGDSVSVGGVGVGFWLGDDDSDRGKGYIYETPQTFTGQTFTNTITALIPAPGPITVGTIHSVLGAFTGEFKFVTPRTAVQYVCDTLSTTNEPVSWRVNGDASLDAGPESDLYVTNPTCVFVRKGFGEDMSMRALEGSMDVEQDMEDFTTRVVLLAEGEGDTVATGSADISGGLNPFKDLLGNTLKLTRLVSESETSTGNATARAQLQLNRFSGTRDALQLSVGDYDVHGSFEVGDYIWVYDPDAGLVDTNNEIMFRGERLNPLKLQVHETSWSITNGYSVGYRDHEGTWYDLTDYVDFETEATSKVVVGAFSRTLSVASGESVGTRPNADTSIPDAPIWVTPFDCQIYLDGQGFSKARVELAWDAPNNTDDTVVIDGDHYDIRYRSAEGFVNLTTWDELASSTWDSLFTWDSPLVEQDDSTWEQMYVSWGESTFFLHELAVNHQYMVQIRLVDRAGNAGAWSDTEYFVTTADDIPPSTPAAPSVAASRIAIQIMHELGKATGGVFNLERDLHHLEVHVGQTQSFTPTTSTLVGTVRATAGMIQGQTPVVATFSVEEVTTIWVRVIAVDIAGNQSAASDAAPVTAELIDSAHISDLTVTKVTAGTISANWLIGASIRTAAAGARVELNEAGFQAYNSAGAKTVDIKSQDGSVSVTGKLQTGFTGQRIIVNPAEGEFGPEIRLHPDASSNYSYLLANVDSGYPYLRIDSGVTTVTGVDESARITAAINSGAELQYRQDGNPRGRVVANRDFAALRRDDAIAYVDETGFHVNNGAGNRAFVRKLADLGRNNTTLNEDDELFVELEANACYILDALVIYSATATGDITIGWTPPSGSTGSYSCFAPGQDITVADAAGYLIRTEYLDLADTIHIGGVGGTTMTAQIRGLINTDVEGRLSLKWAQASTDAGTPTFVRSHSYIRCIREI
ncbi:hypothetical protein [Streptomyces phaeochromogenes]